MKPFLLVANSLVVTAFLLSNVLVADKIIIDEVSRLRDSLRVNDPGRPDLTLRLADLYFNEAMEEARTSDTRSNEKIRKFYSKANALYQEALSGQNGLFERPTGLKKLKIDFQIARIYLEEGKTHRAQKILEELVAQNDLIEIKRESALRLAEVEEKVSSPRARDRARNYYKIVIDHCQGRDVCSYARYRMAWIYYQDNQIEPALQEMRLALWDSKNQIREEALRDLIVFFSNKKTDGFAELSELEPIAEKLNRPQLLDQLAEGFNVVGNRAAWANVAKVIDNRNPNKVTQVRLAEEMLSRRDWSGLDDYLQKLSGVTKADLPKNKDDIANVEKVLRRLLVQLDGMRKTDSETATEPFEKSLFVYLGFFPKGKLRARMIDGWLATIKDSLKRLAQLEKWISEEKQWGNVKEEIRLRQVRASTAQAAKIHLVVIAEASALAKLLESDNSEKRKYTYIAARSLYETGKLDEAIAKFSLLSEQKGSNGTLDQWGVQSRHLILDILNQRKNYREIATRAEAWGQTEFAKIGNQAKFELAASLGDSQEALNLFWEFCQKDQFKPQSCDNTKVLSARLKNQKVLISVLNKLNLQSELASEYEAAGYFGSAAKIYERQIDSKSKINDSLRVALLYELDGDLTSRNRVLKGALKSFSSTKNEVASSDRELLFRMLVDADWLGQNPLALPWSKKRKLEIANFLALSGKPSKEAKSLLLGSEEYVGGAWADLIWKKIEILESAQVKQKFYGRQSKTKFNSRVKKLNAFKEYAEKYLSGMPLGMRLAVISRLEKAYLGLAAEINATPFPEGLDEATVAGLKKSLAEMAMPFENAGLAYQKLGQDQLATEKDTTKMAELQAAYTNSQPPKDLFNFSALKLGAKLGSLSRSPIEKSVAELNQNPSSRAALAQLKDFFQGSGFERLAAYFDGRIAQLKVEGNL